MSWADVVSLGALVRLEDIDGDLFLLHPGLVEPVGRLRALPSLESFWKTPNPFLPQNSAQA